MLECFLCGSCVDTCPKHVIGKQITPHLQTAGRDFYWSKLDKEHLDISLIQTI
jgi:formate hydrogenlyase subunit 6/NADH:ubiquinone oxidoreductase subunit I